MEHSSSAHIKVKYKFHQIPYPSSASVLNNVQQNNPPKVTEKPAIRAGREGISMANELMMHQNCKNRANSPTEQILQLNPPRKGKKVHEIRCRPETKVSIGIFRQIKWFKQQSPESGAIKPDSDQE